ncbi:MAG: hypothetical protein CMK09_06710 [Ponticaulis sp.]|nr:hypothetical protein [Ponticaulis sp.]|tara:strand:- start:9677 stop:11428 length:1752 start_codon:yes stop_codon:yes gene_type:complete
MKAFNRLIMAAVSGLALAACTTPSATYVNWVHDTKPAEADQYSDFLVGRYASLTNDPALAAETFVRASAREPEDPILLERAVFSLLLAGEADEAVRLAQSAQKQQIELSSLSRLTLGIAEMDEGDYANAQFILTHGDVGLFNRVVAKSISAWAALGEGDLDAAENYLIESLVGDNVLDGVSLYMLALIQMSSGQDEAALETFEAVWDERMRLAIACEHYVRLLAAKGEIEKALEVTSQFREEIGLNPNVEWLTARLEAGDPIEVKRLSAREGAAVSVYALATALAMETRDDVASVYFNLALKLDPELDIARTMLGNTLEFSERREEAVQVLKEVGVDSPFYAASQGQLAWALLRLDRKDEAIAVAQQAYDRTGDRDLAMQLGDLYRTTEQYEQAFQWFDRVVKEDEANGDEDWRAYYARAIVYQELDNWGAAEIDLLRSLEIDDRQAQVLNYLGYSWVDRGENLEKAFDLIQEAVSLKPNSGYIVDSLGWAYFKLGQYDLAVLYLERAVELTPDDPTLNDHLGDAYWRVGREIEARFQWRHALALEPESDQIPLLQAKLESGLKTPPQPVMAGGDEAFGKPKQ